MLTLKRVAYTESETFGVLIRDGVPFAVTLEEAWRENRPSVSCIPNGNYQCKRIISPKFGETFEVAAVPGRTHILFHVGNTHRDTEGCILVAQYFERIGEMNAVLGSRQAFPAFMERLRGINLFNLLITK